jgi:hypothetical protein
VFTKLKAGLSKIGKGFLDGRFRRQRGLNSGKPYLLQAFKVKM